MCKIPLGTAMTTALATASASSVGDGNGDKESFFCVFFLLKVTSVDISLFDKCHFLPSKR